jgi:hypothetical protein
LGTRLFSDTLAPLRPRSEQEGIRFLYREGSPTAALSDPLRDRILVLQVLIVAL